METIHEVINTFIFIVSIIILSGSIFAFVLVTTKNKPKKTHYKYIEKSVQKYSLRYSQIQELNSTIHFKDIEKTTVLYATCNTIREFDDFDADKYILNSLLYYGFEDVIENFYNQAKFNKKQYELYMEKISAIPPTDENHIKNNTKISVDSFHKIERSLCEDAVLVPADDPVLIVKAQYFSPKGRNSQVKTQYYSVEQVEKILQDAEKRKSEDESRKKTLQFLAEKYKYSEDYNTSYKQHQRSLMTRKMRYEILKRDHFRCTICGASVADGAKLEVDHIKPISKGGKTEPNNLRTLCQSCNRGKRDRYDPQGVN